MSVTTQRRPEKRGALEICADMLLALEDLAECNRATLATESKLDSRALSKYLGILQAHELVEVTPGNRRVRIKISPKGKAFLGHYSRIASMLIQ